MALIVFLVESRLAILTFFLSLPPGGVAEDFHLIFAAGVLCLIFGFMLYILTVLFKTLGGMLAGKSWPSIDWEVSNVGKFCSSKAGIIGWNSCYHFVPPLTIFFFIFFYSFSDFHYNFSHGPNCVIMVISPISELKTFIHGSSVPCNILLIHVILRVFIKFVIFVIFKPPLVIGCWRSFLATLSGLPSHMNAYINFSKFSMMAFWGFGSELNRCTYLLIICVHNRYLSNGHKIPLIPMVHSVFSLIKVFIIV